MIERYNSLRNELGHRLYNGRDPGTIVTTSGNNIYYKPKDCRTADLLGDVIGLCIPEGSDDQAAGRG